MSKPNFQQKGQTSVESSFHGAANFFAMTAAFLLFPLIYSVSADPVYAYFLKSLNDAVLADLMVYVWTFLCTAVAFFLCRAVVVLAIMIIAQRLLVYVL